MVYLVYFVVMLRVALPMEAVVLNHTKSESRRTHSFVSSSPRTALSALLILPTSLESIAFDVLICLQGN